MQTRQKQKKRMAIMPSKVVSPRSQKMLKKSVANLKMKLASVPVDLPLFVET